MSVFSDTLVQRLAVAVRVGVLTGAGISAESGIDTFRGARGLWKKFKPEELASMDAFLKNPQLVLQWYEYRRRIIKSVKPNPAHHVLMEMEKHFAHFAISTQNIDSLHFKAGSKNVLELHGNILKNRCTRCGCSNFHPETGQNGQPQKCGCGGLFRPDVVWFGEMLPEDALTESFEIAGRADVYFSIGTSAVVYPAAMLPVTAADAGAYVVEINTEKTAITNRTHESIRGKAGEILPALWRVVKSRLEETI